LEHNYWSYYIPGLNLSVIQGFFNRRENKRVSAEVMRTATKMVLIEGMSRNRVSADLEIPRTTLTHYVEESRLKGLDSVVDFQKSKAHHRSVLTKEIRN